MEKFTVEMTGVKEQKSLFEIAPTGIYTLKVVSGEYGKSKQGNDQVITKFVITDEAFYGVEITHYFSLVEKMKGLFRYFLRLIGQEIQDSCSCDISLWKNREVLANVIIDSYINNKGEERQSNKIKKFLDLDKKVEQMDDVPF